MYWNLYVKLFNFLFILRITATDRDASAKYNTVTYWIGKGKDAGDFYMDHKTAQIYLLKPLDYEKKKQYILTVGSKNFMNMCKIIFFSEVLSNWI